MIHRESLEIHKKVVCGVFPQLVRTSVIRDDTNKPTKLVLNSVIVMLNSFNCDLSETIRIYKFHSDYYDGLFCV